MIKKIVIASILGTLALTNYAEASTTEVWTSLTIKGKLSNNTSLKIKEEFRFSNLNDPKLKSQRTEVVIGWKINNIITAIGGYKNTSEGEQRPYIGAKISTSNLFVVLYSISSIFSGMVFICTRGYPVTVSVVLYNLVSFFGLNRLTIRLFFSPLLISRREIVLMSISKLTCTSSVTVVIPPPPPPPDVITVVVDCSQSESVT